MGKHKKPKIQKAIGVRPYNSKGKSNLGFTTGKTGVYIIREKKPGKRYKTVYVGSSIGNLYKTITRHFQEWNATNPMTGEKIERVTYVKGLKRNKYIVQVIFCHHKQVRPLEAGLIEKYKPPGNTHIEEPHLTDTAERLVNHVEQLDYTDLDEDEIDVGF